MSIGRFTPAVRFNDRVPGCAENDPRHRKFNYDLCQGINMINLGIVLDDMVRAGTLKKNKLLFIMIKLVDY